MRKVHDIYTNKDASFFEQLGDGVLQPRMKDQSGDPRSPINGQLPGIFFGVNLYRNKLPTKSPYGNTRFILPLQKIIHSATNIYFADFYCFGPNSPHYIILVVTEKYSDGDKFCSSRLIKLNPENNPFLVQNGKDYFYGEREKHSPWIEIFYSGAIHLRDGEIIHNIPVFRQSKRFGKLIKSPHCTYCNLKQH